MVKGMKFLTHPTLAVPVAIKLKKDFKNEIQDRYVKEEDLQQYCVTISGNSILDARGKKFKSVQLLYVMSLSNDIYAVPHQPHWHHSYFLSGKKVKAAGNIVIDNSGYIESISNESGHYTPTFREMIPALNVFNDLIEDTELVQFINHDRVPEEKIIEEYYLEEIVANFKEIQDLKKRNEFATVKYLEPAIGEDVRASQLSKFCGDYEIVNADPVRMQSTFGLKLNPALLRSR